MSEIGAETPSEAIEPTEDTSQSPQAPVTDAAQTTETPDYFGDNFDPNTLDEALRPGWKSLQSDYTRKMQDLAEQRQQASSVTAALTDLRSEQPEIRQGALQWLTEADLLTEEMVADAFGWEIEPEAPDDLEQPMTRAEFEAWQANKNAEEQAAKQVADQQAWAESEDQRINAELNELGNGELTDRARDLIFANALFAAQKGLTEGIDIKRAHAEYEAELNDRLRGWRDGKSAAQPTPANGEAATEVPDMDTHEGRVAAMMSRLQPGPQ